jgi:hypothetical protein
MARIPQLTSRLVFLHGAGVHVTLTPFADQQRKAPASWPGPGQGGWGMPTKPADLIVTQYDFLHD